MGSPSSVLFAETYRVPADSVIRYITDGCLCRSAKFERIHDQFLCFRRGVLYAYNNKRVRAVNLGKFPVINLSTHKEEFLPDSIYMSIYLTRNRLDFARIDPKTYNVTDYPAVDLFEAHTLLEDATDLKPFKAKKRIEGLYLHTCGMDTDTIVEAREICYKKDLDALYESARKMHRDCSLPPKGWALLDLPNQRLDYATFQMDCGLGNMFYACPRRLTGGKNVCESDN
jgi:hypothetical protein